MFMNDVLGKSERNVRSGVTAKEVLIEYKKKLVATVGRNKGENSMNMNFKYLVTRKEAQNAFRDRQKIEIEKATSEWRFALAQRRKFYCPALSTSTSVRPDGSRLNKRLYVSRGFPLANDLKEKYVNEDTIFRVCFPRLYTSFNDSSKYTLEYFKEPRKPPNKASLTITDADIVQFIQFAILQMDVNQAKKDYPQGNSAALYRAVRGEEVNRHVADIRKSAAKRMLLKPQTT